MITLNANVTSAINSPVRDIRARVELYNGSTLVETCNCNDRLMKFTVERVCEEGKFFGFGICQKINIHLIDKERTLEITTANSIKVAYIIEEEAIYPYPTFYVSQVRRDENTNELSITGYDVMYPDSAHLVRDMALTAPYTGAEFARAAAAALGASGLSTVNITTSDSAFDLVYIEGANFDGSETIREALNDLAEATQTIFYINRNNQLVFKRLYTEGTTAVYINQDKYFNLETSDNRRLGTITHTTELGDNVSASTTETGSTQYVRDNAFWELREDVGTLVENAVAAVGGMTIKQFDCNWRGDICLEVGDKIFLTEKSGTNWCAYVLDDVIEYTGALAETSRWAYTVNNLETEDNPTSIGDKLNQTFARVDKVNREIELVVQETQEMSDEVAGVVQDMSSLKLTSQNIVATVAQVQNNTDTALENINGELADLATQVSATISAENIAILIQKELAEGVNTVTTQTGFTFDSDGLLIEKSGSEMSTQITEDGMKVYRDDTEVLIANNVGVEATNLHARTYLIVGNYSRFEDYTDEEDQPRTGCFWIGP